MSGKSNVARFARYLWRLFIKNKFVWLSIILIDLIEIILILNSLIWMTTGSSPGIRNNFHVASVIIKLLFSRSLVFWLMSWLIMTIILTKRFLIQITDSTLLIRLILLSARLRKINLTISGLLINSNAGCLISLYLASLLIILLPIPYSLLVWINVAIGILFQILLIRSVWLSKDMTYILIQIICVAMGLTLRKEWNLLIGLRRVLSDKRVMFSSVSKWSWWLYHGAKRVYFRLLNSFLTFYYFIIALFLSTSII